MRVALTYLAALVLAAAPLRAGQALEVPSGRTVTLHDEIWNAPGNDGLAVRFRFIVPDIGGGGGNVGDVDFVQVGADMLFLCETYALPRLAAAGPPPGQVIISLSDRPVEFGVADPDATQYFEIYRPENGECVWEGF